MPRKLRLEFPGACYHVINRGNYRADVFRSAKTKAAFEACLFEACAKSGWVLHAFVVMRNHFHLALETPHGNLVTGMQWLQATFANRFNRLRGERGHLFQGRYKALVVEDGDPWGLVCHYIHLNPVRAGIVPVARLAEYRSSSYWYLRQRRRRAACLRLATALTAAGGLGDDPDGWRRYGDYLAWQAIEGPVGRSKAYVSLSRGWALGSAGFKRTLVLDHALVAASRAWENQGAREIREQGWTELLRQALAVVGRPDDELTVGPVSAPWKVAVATFLKERSQVSNSWLAQQLGTSRATYVSRLVSGARRIAPPPVELLALREQCTT